MLLKPTSHTPDSPSPPRRGVGERSRRSPLAPTSTRFSLLLVSIAAVLFLVHGVLPFAGKLSHGYAAYYTSAWLVWHDEDAARFYDNRWFMEQLPRAGFDDVRDIYNVNPPATALLFLPLLPFSPEHADVVWSVANLALLAVALAILLRALGAAGLVARGDVTLPAVLVTYALVYNPLYENMHYGQVYLLLLVPLSLALLGYVDRRDRLLGVCLGLLLLFKGAAALLWLAPLLDRRWRALGWGAGTAAAGVLATVPVVGVGAWREYVTWLPGLTNRPWTGVTAYQTLPSIVHHLTRQHDLYTPTPVVSAPWLAAPLATALSVALLAAAVACGWLLSRTVDGPRARLLRVTLLLALAVPLQPLGEEHHYVLLLPVALVALALLAGGLGQRQPLAALAAIAGLVALAAPYDYWAEPLRHGWRALLAYPKLYGALLLAGAIAAALEPTLDRLPVARRRPAPAPEQPAQPHL